MALIEERRWYHIAADRQVVRMRGENIYKIRVDHLETLSFFETTIDEVTIATRSKVLQHPGGPSLTPESDIEGPTRPGSLEITLGQPRPSSDGESLDVCRRVIRCRALSVTASRSGATRIDTPDVRM
jgi:hypothetical protein